MLIIKILSSEELFIAKTNVGVVDFHKKIMQATLGLAKLSKDFDDIVSKKPEQRNNINKRSK